MSVKTVFSCVALLCTFVFVSSALAVTITTASGTNGADTWVASNEPDTALGDADPDRLRVRSSGSIRKTYLRFDLSALGFDPSRTASATLLLFADETDDFRPNTIEVYGINDGIAGDGLEDWSESTLTWNESASVQNDLSSGTGVLDDETTLVADLTIEANPEGDPARFDYEGGHPFIFENAGDGLESFLQTDTNGLASFILIYTEPSGSSVTFNSKEDPTFLFPTLVAQPGLVSVDFDNDGDADGDDLDALVGEIIAASNDSEFDLSGDGAVDNSDLTQWRSDAATRNGFTAPYLLGDANLDGSVNATDLNALGQNWRGHPNAWQSGDFTADGTVDASDLNALGQNWRASIPIAAAQTTAVPEPATHVVLVLFGTLMFALKSRKHDTRFRI